jgi:hypothetical protein
LFDGCLAISILCHYRIAVNTDAAFIVQLEKDFFSLIRRGFITKNHYQHSVHDVLTPLFRFVKTSQAVSQMAAVSKSRFT